MRRVDFSHEGQSQPGDGESLHIDNLDSSERAMLREFARTLREHRVSNPVVRERLDTISDLFEDSASGA